MTTHRDAFIGTSGFSYASWKGAFYPAQAPSREWLRFYAEQFNSIEITRSFYRDPAAATLKRWREDVPASFRFSLKASRLITHLKKIQDCALELEHLWQSYRALGPQLGCVFFQLPSTMSVDPQRLAAFLEEVKSSKRHWNGIEPLLALEARNASWHIPAVFDLLRRHGMALVTHDMPNKGEWTPSMSEDGRSGFVWETGDGMTMDEWIAYGEASFFYLRLHGNVNGEPWKEYGAHHLVPWIVATRKALASGKTVFAHFNNDPDAAAVRDAERLQQAITRTEAS